MAETDGASKVSAFPRPTITLPPRPSIDALFPGGLGFSPGPMTLVSNFFTDYYPDSDCLSFSQLLAGAMASPVAAIAGGKPSFSADTQINNPLKEGDIEEGSEKNLGFKQNRPMNLVVPHSPMFMIPPGLSPSGLLNSPGFFSPIQSPFGMSHQQALAHVTAQAVLSQSLMQAASTESFIQQPSFALYATTEQQMNTLIADPESSKIESSEVSQSDRQPRPASIAINKPANDGYNWRKYGQKQVKASNYPRSYYKCTHPNCLVTKKVERSLDGQITEIIYKGQHNHELPRPNKCAKDGGEPDGTLNSQVKAEISLQSQMEMSRSSEAVPSHSVARNDQVSTQLTSEWLPGSKDQEEMDDAETRFNDEEGETNSNISNTEVRQSELTSSHKTITESRIIVQTKSEVDLLDDGYKWRKYGQKLVKGNPHPRSYYKCTFAGCNVRKHVERASADPKAVITAYEGKHNHDIPAGRKSCHNTGSGNSLQSKRQKMVAVKPSLDKDMDFGNKNQRRAFSQLKEEQIIA